MEKLLELGSHYASDFIKKDENYLDRPKFSLDLILDERLGAARLAELTPTEVMFGKYWYSSRINEGMVSQLKDIVDEVSSRVKHEVGDVWLDIAANDGTLLKMVPNSFTKVGIDPADDTFLAESSKVATMVQDFFSVDAYNRSGFGDKKPKVITTIAMFYDLEDPDSFIKDIVEILDDNGVWVIQMSYTPLMIKQLAFDNTCFKSDTFILGANKYIDSVNIGDKVIDQNGGFSEVTKTFERDYDGPMIKIKPKFLNWIEATPEHPVLVVKKSNLETLNREWCSIKDIESGDFVVVPRIKTYPINRFVDLSKYNNTDSPNYRRGLKSIYLTDDVLWMLGLFVAEGHIGGVPTNLQIEFTLHQKEHYYYDRIVSIFKSLGYKTRVRPSKLSKAVNVQVSCTALANMLIEWFGRGARNKRIPDFLFTAESDVIIPFLNGLIDGDGSIDCNGQVSLHLSSRTLIEQVQLMLANLDSLLGFSYVKPYASMLNGNVVKGGDSWQLRRKHVNLDQIFNTQHNRVRKEQKFPTDNKYLYLPVQKIESNNFTGKVYNIETSSNTYLVSNAVVHNCGEHVYYYSLNSIKKLIEPHSLKIVDCSINQTNGGSFRVTMQKTCADPDSFANQPVRDCCDVRIDSLLNWERTCCDISDPDLWYQFQRDIDTLRETTVSFIKAAKAEGKTVAGIGASTKGNTLLQYFGLDSTLIDFISERSPAKHGLYTIGTNIPIVSEEEARARKPSYMLMLPWHFVSEIIHREQEYLNGGGKFIVPIPKFTIISK